MTVMNANWLKRIFEETNGTPSSMRVALLCIVAVIVGVVCYCVTRHILSREPFDLGPNLTNLLSVTIGSLSAAKLGSKFGERNDGGQNS
jgi:xanthosine utilization system XapX-like protein